MFGRSERDAGLQRVSRITRWVAAGAVGAAGLFSAVAAKAAPGHTTQRAQSNSTGASGGEDSGPGNGLGTGQSDPGLSPPAAVPQPAAGTPSVVSGGS